MDGWAAGWRNFIISRQHLSPFVPTSSSSSSALQLGASQLERSHKSPLRQGSEMRSEQKTARFNLGSLKIDSEF